MLCFVDLIGKKSLICETSKLADDPMTMSQQLDQELINMNVKTFSSTRSAL